MHCLVRWKGDYKKLHNVAQESSSVLVVVYVFVLLLLFYYDYFELIILIVISLQMNVELGLLTYLARWGERERETGSLALTTEWWMSSGLEVRRRRLTAADWRRFINIIVSLWPATGAIWPNDNISIWPTITPDVLTDVTICCVGYNSE